MKKLILPLALLIALCLPFSAAAQTAITTTTLTNAITTASPTSLNIVVGSNSGMVVNGILYIDGSVYRITAIASTTISVIQQYMPATHNSGVTVYVVPVNAQIGKNPVGSCLRSTAGQFPAYSPYGWMFNLQTGDIATCRATSNTASTNAWVITNPYGYAASSAPPATR